ncbi:MAG: lactate permease LctP family transporter [Opitutaceae bacterium]
MPWIQAYDPINGSIGLSAAVAAVPIAVVFVCLAILRVKAFKAVILALASAFALSVSVWGMPAKLACLATLHGAAFGLFPVYFIVLATLFLYNITVRGGQFDVIRASLAGVTPDRRLQALLIAFCFGAFIEGAAGFGTPVAIAGATLAGLGFRPFYAAGICLVANTAPVAFGALGTAIVALGGVMGLNDEGLAKLSIMVGNQLTVVSLIVPPYLVLLMAGFRRTLEVLPAIVVCAVTFAGCQWAAACFLGPYLPDIIASLASMAALVLLLRVWKPRTVFGFGHERTPEPESHGYTVAQVARAWAPYFALTFVVLLWGLPPVKAALGRSTLIIPVAGLDNAIARMPTALPGAAPGPVRLPARFRLDYLASGGSAVFIAALASAALCGLGAGETARLLGRTIYDLRFPAATIAAVMALAYVMNASGMTVCLGIWCTGAGRLFPLLSPALGWLGVFLTGSDTSSNVLFGGLQKAAAERLGINPLLTGAANASGGVVGKMISPQSLVVACAATGMVGEEGSLLRFTLKHSLVLLGAVCVVVYVAAYYAPWMIPR